MIEINIESVEDTFEINSEIVKELVTQVFDNRDVKDAKITIILGNDKMLHNLKQYYFHRDVYTDVISFRLDTEKNEPFEGEIYISLQMAENNASKYRVTFENELSRLILHGSLHLVGYKDENAQQKAEIRKLEDRFLQQIDHSKLVL